MKMRAALLGAGYILGARVATIIVSGSLLSFLVIIPAIATWGASKPQPVYPATVYTIAQMSAMDVWERYVCYTGAGAVATAGLVTLIRSIPTMIDSFRIGTQRLATRFDEAGPAVLRTARDLPPRFVGIAVVVVATPWPWCLTSWEPSRVLPLERRRPSARFCSWFSRPISHGVVEDVGWVIDAPVRGVGTAHQDPTILRPAGAHEDQVVGASHIERFPGVTSPHAIYMYAIFMTPLMKLFGRDRI